MSTVLVRPCLPTDVDALFALAEQTGPGMTNLPADRDLLAKKIHRSVISFRKKVKQPGEEYYLFVLETTDTQQVIGCSAIVGAVGKEYPFYNYKVSREELVCISLGLHKTMDLLYLAHDYNDMSEVCSLFLLPQYRASHYGKLLSLSRFLFLADFPQQFGEKIFAEMRGVFDDKGQSPFWEGMVRHFFHMDFALADKLSSRGEKQFISDLMPRCPIYVSLLPLDAQAVIGQVHPAAKPALAFLQREGFRYQRYIDIFDGGPVVEAAREDLRTVSKSSIMVVERLVDEETVGVTTLLSNGAINFRACIAHIPTTHEQQIVLDKRTAEILQVGVGDKVRRIEL